FSLDIEGVDDDIDFDETGTTVSLEPGAYVASEDDLDDDDFNFIGWALGDGAACPDEPTNTEGTDIPLTIVANETVHLCIYNEAAPPVIDTGSLTVTKAGGQGLTFTYDVLAGDDTVRSNVPFNAAGTTIELEADTYTLV